MRPEIPGDVKKIVIMRALHLGDLLLAMPAFRGIRAAFPDAEITWIGLAWAGSFARRFGRYVDRLVQFPGYPGILEVEYEPEKTAAWLSEARDYRYDLAIQMHGSGRTTNPFVLDLHARATVGYYDPAVGPQPGMTISAPYPDRLPEVRRNLGLLDLLGIPAQGEHLEFPLFPEDEAAADALMRRHGLDDHRRAGPLVGMHVGARPPARRWPPEHFAAVGDALVREQGATVVLTGGPGVEVAIADRVRSKMREPAVSVAGETTIPSLGALMRRLDLYISNDTGPAHLAVAVDVPSIRIFGPADYKRWGPLDQIRHRIVRRDVWCSPCPYWECPFQDHACLRWVYPADVLAVARELLPGYASERALPAYPDIAA